MKNKITGWLSIGSTYTYLTALRLEDLISKKKLNLEIKPISIRNIMRSMNNIPFPPEKKEKVNYMWRDIERRAAVYGLPSPNVPAPYPLKDFDTANLVGIVLNNKNLYLKYFDLTYRYWFIEGIEAGSEANIRKCLSDMRQDYTEIMELAASPHIKEMYEKNTLEALNFGVFGAPTFSVGNELFWGDDRLEDAINFIGEMACD